MDPSLVPSLPGAISAPRLAPYLRRYQGNTAMAIRLYMWNVEMSAAFWGPLCLFEVTLRNALHDAMRANRIDDWWNLKAVNLESREDRRIEAALDKLAFAGNVAPTPDDVVAATSLGLWVGLTGIGASRHPLYDYETNLWPTISSAFPNRGSWGRRQVHNKLNRVRVLRNRIAHHEPIFLQPHGQQRDLVIESIALLDADVAHFVASTHRIDDVLTSKQDSVANGVCRF